MAKLAVARPAIWKKIKLTFSVGRGMLSYSQNLLSGGRPGLKKADPLDHIGWIASARGQWEYRVPYFARIEDSIVLDPRKSSIYD